MRRSKAHTRSDTEIKDGYKKNARLVHVEMGDERIMVISFFAAPSTAGDGSASNVWNEWWESRPTSHI